MTLDLDHLPGTPRSVLPPALASSLFASVDTSQYDVGSMEIAGLEIPNVQCEKDQPSPIQLSVQFGGVSFDWPFEYLVEFRALAQDGKTLLLLWSRGVRRQ